MLMLSTSDGESETWPMDMMKEWKMESEIANRVELGLGLKHDNEINHKTRDDTQIRRRNHSVRDTETRANTLNVEQYERMAELLRMRSYAGKWVAKTKPLHKQKHWHEKDPERDVA